MAKLAELADHLGLSVARISQLKSAGILPDAPRGKHDLDACRAAYLAHLREVAAGRGSKDGALDLVAERARLARAQAKRVERENKVAEGELFPAEEFRTTIDYVFTRVRQRILAVPSKIAPHLVGLETPQEAQKIVRAACHEALRELAATGRESKDGEGGRTGTPEG